MLYEVITLAAAVRAAKGYVTAAIEAADRLEELEVRGRRERNNFV